MWPASLSPPALSAQTDSPRYRHVTGARLGENSAARAWPWAGKRGGSLEPNRARRNERDLAETEARLRDLTDTIPGAISQLRYHRAEGDDIEGLIRRTAPHVLSYQSTGKIEVSHRLHGQRPYACG
ncbi:MAG: hypothetical protein BRD57_01925 [Proteobacteria bacterium SW_6_67_9]|nr:MAG: hypothetical protein BRD57_01925 [Proteobacteria bacterium SW_6_67_9]